jgi:hypothetical protein
MEDFALNRVLDVCRRILTEVGDDPAVASNLVIAYQLVQMGTDVKSVESGVRAVASVIKAPTR